MVAGVCTESGQVSGSGTDVAAYLGIPYAAPPVGPLRWRPPQKAPPWRGVRECTHWGDDPPQAPNPGLRGPRISEDCLTLNIWTPAERPKPLPVLFWIFGGGFVSGSSSLPMYDGAALARRGAVVVTINYRLGLFGFMAHPALTRESPYRSSGNYGFLDQLAALTWVRENIAGFGGDPDNVTIAGESAGADAVAALLLSPMSAGLFHRAIIQSAGVLRKFFTLAEMEKAAAAAVGDDIAALRAAPMADLLPKTQQLAGVPRRLAAPQPIRMVTDGWAFPEDGRAAFLAGRFAKVPLMIGAVEDEGPFFTARMPVKTLADYRGYLDAGLGPFAAEGWRLYPATSDADFARPLAESFADSLFHYSIRGLARLAAEAGVPTYRYLFTQRRNGEARPPSHVEEVPFMFGNLDASFFGRVPGANARDRELSATMIGAWVRFAATGDPNGGGLAWPAYDPARDNYLVFGDPIAEGARWRTPYLDFFERVFAAS